MKSKDRIMSGNMLYYDLIILFLCILLQTSAGFEPTKSPDAETVDGNEISFEMSSESITADVTMGPAECKLTQSGSEYVGTLSTTMRGFTCQEWKRQMPHRHEFTHGSDFPDNSLDLVKNYCRNPNGDQNGPWCLTTDPNLRYEYCEVEYCDTEAATETTPFKCGVIDDYGETTEPVWTEDQQKTDDTNIDEFVPSIEQPDPKSTTEDPNDNLSASKSPNHNPGRDQPSPNPLTDVPATETTTLGTKKCLETEFTDITGALRLGLFKKLGLSFILTIGVSNKINICLMERFDKLKAELGVSCTITELPNKKLKLKATAELTAKIKSNYKYIGPRPSDGAPQYSDRAGYVYTLVGDCWETD